MGTELPTWNEIVTAAGMSLDTARNAASVTGEWMRSDRPAGTRPTRDAAAARREVLDIVEQIKDLVDRGKDALDRARTQP